MIISCGVDVCETARIAQMVADHGDAFLKRTFSSEELAYAQGRARESEHLAARFAAKEAVMKALGTGWSSGVSWLDISVSLPPSGAPALAVTGKASEIARQRGITKWHLSLSHCDSFGIAMVVAEGPDAEG